jgi:hypothetical protein
MTPDFKQTPETPCSNNILLARKDIVAIFDEILPEFLKNAAVADKGACVISHKGDYATLTYNYNQEDDAEMFFSFRIVSPGPIQEMHHIPETRMPYPSRDTAWFRVNIDHMQGIVEIGIQRYMHSTEHDVKAASLLREMLQGLDINSAGSMKYWGERLDRALAVKNYEEIKATQSLIRMRHMPELDRGFIGLLNQPTRLQAIAKCALWNALGNRVDSDQKEQFVAWLNGSVLKVFDDPQSAAYELGAIRGKPLLTQTLYDIISDYIKQVDSLGRGLHSITS